MTNKRAIVSCEPPTIAVAFSNPHERRCSACLPHQRSRIPLASRRTNNAAQRRKIVEKRPNKPFSFNDFRTLFKILATH
jgi:hypothetical protein